MPSGSGCLMALRSGPHQGCVWRQLGPKTPEALNPQGSGPFSSTAPTLQPTLSLITCPAPLLTPRLLVTSPVLSFRPPRMKPSLLPGCVTLGESLNLSGPVSSCVKWGEGPYSLTWLWAGVKGMIYVKCLTWAQHVARA